MMMMIIYKQKHKITVIIVAQKQLITNCWISSLFHCSFV